jgi:hypothetical protein
MMLYIKVEIRMTMMKKYMCIFSNNNWILSFFQSLVHGKANRQSELEQGGLKRSNSRFIYA